MILPDAGTLLLFMTAALALNVIRAGAWSRRRFGESAFMRRLTGVLFIALGVRLALLERR